MAVVINNVKKGKRLGNGAFGEVHEATLAPHGSIALKTMKRADICAFFSIALTDWPAVRDQMFSEAEWLKRGEHDNVVRVHGVGYDRAKERGYIVTELCDGGSVAGLLAAGPLPLERVSRYTRDALLGLEALHRRGMIHRDIKPPNILIKAGAAKLSDFGLVTDQLIAGYADRQGYTEFLAPEVHSTWSTSFRTDVWAMGLTIYRMLSGNPWYDEFLLSIGADKSVDARAALNAIVGAVTGGGFASSLPFLPSVPDGWRRFVRKALHDDPHERFDDGTVMLSAMSSRELTSVPSYVCNITTSLVTWQRPREGREEVIEWRRGATRNGHDVLAVLRPAAGVTGKTTTLRRQTALTKAKAMDVLQDFFAARTT